MVIWRKFHIPPPWEIKSMLPTSFLYYNFSTKCAPTSPFHLPFCFDTLTNRSSVSLSVFLIRKSNRRVITTTATVRMSAVKTMWMTTAPGTLSKPHSESILFVFSCLVSGSLTLGLPISAWYTEILYKCGKKSKYPNCNHIFTHNKHNTQFSFLRSIL